MDFAPFANPHASMRELRQMPIWEHFFVRDEAHLPAYNPVIMPLDNQIHPLWRWKAFRNYPYDRNALDTIYDQDRYDMSLVFYQRLRPALQLASHFLLRSHPFLVRILRGPLIRTHRGDYHYDPDWRPTWDDYEGLNHELNDLARELRWFYIVPHEIHRGAGFINGITTWQPQGSDLSAPIIGGLASEIIYEFANDSWLSKTDFQRAAMLVKVSETLIHELSHALRGRRLHAESDLVPDDLLWDHFHSQEPAMFPDQFHETGHSITKFLWGCDIHFPYGFYETRWDIEAGIGPQHRPIFDGTFGVYAHTFDDHRSLASERVHPFTAKTLFAFFDKRTWQNQKQTLYLYDTTTPRFPNDFIIDRRMPGVRGRPMMLFNGATGIIQVPRWQQRALGSRNFNLTPEVAARLEAMLRADKHRRESMESLTTEFSCGKP